MQIGSYEVIAEIGRGASGVVFRARSPSGHDVAIKLLLGLDQARRGRFERERRLLASLGEKQGFLPLVEAGETPRGPFLVTPFAEGGTLRDRLRDGGALEARVALALVEALAVAIGHAHVLGCVHRDLKPENILFTARGPEGRPLIADLGLAKEWTSAEAHALSRTGELRGTVGYMAPEQMADAKAAGPAADVFALGVIAFECLSGEMPFAADSFIEQLDRVRSGTRAPLAKLCPGLPRAVVAVVESALAVDPDRRPPDGAAFAAALRASATQARARSRASIVAASFAVTLAVLGAGGWALLPHRGGDGVAPLGSSAAPAPPPVVSPPAPMPPTAPPPTPAPSSPPPSALEGPLADLADVRETATLRLVQVLGDPSWRTASTISGMALASGGRKLVTLEEAKILRFFETSSGHPAHAYAALRRDTQMGVLSSDGASLFHANRTEQGRVTDVATAVEVSVLAGPAGREVRLAAWSPDGARIATSGAVKNEVSLWHARSGDLVGTLATGDARVTSLALRAQGEVVAGSDDGALAILDLVGRERRAVPRGAPAAVLSIAVSASGDLAVAGCADGSVVWLDLVRGEVERVAAKVHKGAVGVNAALLTRDGRFAVTAGGKDEVFVWDVATRTKTREWSWPRVDPKPETSIGLCESWEPGVILLASPLRRLELATGVERLLGEGHTGWVTGVAALVAGEVATASRDGSVRVFDAAGHGRLLDGGAPFWINALAAAPDGRRFATGAFDGTVLLWDPRETRRLGRASLDAPVASVQLLDDGDVLAAGAKGWVSQLAGTTLEPRGLHHDVGRGTLFGAAARGSRLVAWRFNGGLSVFELPSLRVVHAMPPAPRSAHSHGLAVAKDGTRAVTGDDLGQLVFWDLVAGEKKRAVKIASEILAVAISPADGRVAVGATGKMIRIFDANGVEIDRVSLAKSYDMPVSLAWSADGRELLVGTARSLVLRFEAR